METSLSKRLVIKGMVQGVGFRPFIFNLANRFSLKGDVSNISSGVLINIEGRAGDIDSFCNLIPVQCPPLALVTDISIQNVSFKKFNDFSISASSMDNDKTGMILSDISICDKCVSEMFDPLDRRFQYPFINCTECGPRYSIIEDIPYDRHKTSMQQFEMCKTCLSEYTDYKNRRFHAQPNACKKCGPELFLYDRHENLISTKNPVKETVSFLKSGYIIAVKGIGGFHLAVDAENDHAVKLLRKRKIRPDKPFAVMSCSIKDIKQYALVEKKEEKSLCSLQRPVVLLKKRTPCFLPEAIAPSNCYIGAMLPYAPLHYLLLKENFTALVMTSGNISSEPVVAENKEAFEKLNDIADYFLINNRDIVHRSDDSVVKYISSAPALIRRSRGYAPAPVFLKKKIPQILACGGDLKSVICLTKNNMAFLSRYIGDIQNPEVFRFYMETIQHMKGILNIEPEIIVHDLHPDYLSSGFAKKYEIENPTVYRISVQHHHAHIAACMAENMINGPVIGCSFDGTGYGTDGCIWGGEVLIVEKHWFQRAAHLSYVPMPGAAAAVREPWRMGISYLFDTFGKEFIDIDIPCLRRADKKKIKIFMNMISAKINSPLTSSIGRLFDAVSSIVGIRNRVTFQGQAAMELESISQKSARGLYEYGWDEKDIRTIDVNPMIRGIVFDILNGVNTSIIGGKFHNTLVRLFADLCGIIGKETGIDKVVLSGGVFVNNILLDGLVRALHDIGFQVFTHMLVPTNDGGLALGQAIIAASEVGDKKK